ncbi:hypothetical protein CBR_g45193 [Chara braunii]|uniref:Myb-like domain-containing protein n=1 Tax=Chara braunii TaxID=69332 RepID=A0A388K391_CHABU|nr:hypothetical protein CBR_g45193 [Chara braunii]|eukprot:GBG64497.1 hypothetical protein CBR_g45193 [Chara braunii]
MADLYRRLPLLLLVVVLLLAVVVFHICCLVRVPCRKQTRRTSKTVRKMERVQTRTTLSVGAAGSSRQRCRSAEAVRRPYDPALYSHLPSHEIPLPPSDDDGDDPRCSTLPLGSGSAQDWMGSQLYRQASTPTYTDLLEGRTPAGYDAGLVDLSFGLRSGSAEEVTRTVIVNRASGTTHTPAPMTTRTGRSVPCRTTTAGGTVDGRRPNDEWSATEIVGRKVWDDHRRQSREASTTSITRGVAKINVGADDIFGDEDGAVAEDCEADDGADNDDEEDDEEMEIRPRPGFASCRPRAHRGKDEDEDMKWDDVEKRLVHMGVTSRKAVDCGNEWDNLYQQFKTVHKFMGESGKPNFFTLTPGERKERGFDFRMDERVYSEMAAMTRSDHTIHPTNLADTGATGGVQMPGPHGGRNESGGSEGGGDGQDDDQGSTRDSISGGGVGGGSKRKNVRQQTLYMIADVMKEHESLMATTVDSASKRQCSILTRQCDILEREVEVQKEHYVKADQANFMMCNALMEIAKAIRERSLRLRGRCFRFADQMPPRGASAKGRKDGGVGNGGEIQRGRGHIPKSNRQRIDDASSSQTDDFLADEVATVDAQGTAGVARLGFGWDGVSREQLQALKHSVVGGAAGTVPRTPDTAEVVITGAEVAGQLSAGQGQPRQPLPLQHVGALGGGHTATAQKAKLWVDCDAFWGQGPGKPLREAVGECTDYFVAIANRDAGVEPPSMLIMPPNDVPHFKINDPAQREPALRRARSVERVVLRTIHDWIFKSQSRSTGFARAELYITVDFATDLARAVWQALEWSRVVSPALVYPTLTMKMDVPLWFAGVKIEDRPEDDDMAARQEATVLRLAECWTDALWCGQWADGGRVKQERLSRLADCLRALLCAVMWIMRMGGDDDRSHYEAWLYAFMVAKPTMIAAGSYIFNWRRHVVDSSNLVLDRLGKVHLTLGDYPQCIPERCDCGLVFGHNAALKNAAEAAKHGWIGSGPAADDDGDDGKLHVISSRWQRVGAHRRRFVDGGDNRRKCAPSVDTVAHRRDGCCQVLGVGGVANR